MFSTLLWKKIFKFFGIL